MKYEDEYFIFDNKKSITLKYYIIFILSALRAALYKLLLLFNKCERAQKEYTVAICAIFKNEAPYLKEWIEYHHIIGVEHFYLYNNNSEDSYENVLKKYVDLGWVTLVDWPHNQMQMEAYKDCIDRFAKETEWLGFIDIDEFVVPKKTNDIAEFLSGFRKYGSVLIYWKLFGSSGKIDRDLKGSVIEDFTVCWPKYCDIGKCFYNTAYQFNQNSRRSNMLHHKLWTVCKRIEIPPVNAFKHVCVGGRNKADSDEFPIQINHYFTKSFSEYEAKRSKGDVYFKINPHDLDYFYEHETKCDSVDYSAYKYLIKLKKRMEED